MLGQKQKIIHATEGPSPSRSVDAQNVESLPFTRARYENIDQVGKTFLGPMDPLSGPSHPDDLDGVVREPNELLSVFKKMLVATRMIHPSMTCDILLRAGNSPSVANELIKLRFEIGGRVIPALSLFMQNNSALVVYYNMDDPANPGTFQLPPGGNVTINDVVVHELDLFTTAVTVINGIQNLRAGSSSTPGLIITAWSNPEWGMAGGML